MYYIIGEESLYCKVQFRLSQERTGDEMEDYLDGGSPCMSLLNVVSVRIPSSKHSAGQVVRLTMRNDATARQVLHTVCEVNAINPVTEVSGDFTFF